MIYGPRSALSNAAVRWGMAASWLGRPGAISGETRLIDLSNSQVTSAGTPRPPPQRRRVPRGLNGAAGTHVHVHPDAVLPADVGNGDEGVEGAVHRRPGGGAHEERNKALS